MPKPGNPSALGRTYPLIACEKGCSRQEWVNASDSLLVRFNYVILRVVAGRQAKVWIIDLERRVNNARTFWATFESDIFWCPNLCAP